MGRSFAELVDAHIEANRTQLPVFDGTAMDIQELMSSDAFDIGAVEDLILKDPVLSSAVLRLANSCFYGGLVPVTNLRDAIVRLGAQKMANLAVLVTQKSSYQVRAASLRPLVGGLWSHSVGCALGSQWLSGRLKRDDVAEHAFMAGMLHDIGKLLVLRVIDDLRQERPDFVPTGNLVREMLSRMHAERGAMLMRKWTIPDVYTHVVAHHHDADADESDVLLLIVRIVDRACNKLGVGIDPDPNANLAASAEAQILGMSEVLAAELETQLEDTPQLAGAV